MLAKYSTKGSLSLAELDALLKDVIYTGGVDPVPGVEPAVLEAFRKHDADSSGQLAVRELRPIPTFSRLLSPSHAFSHLPTPARAFSHLLRSASSTRSCASSASTRTSSHRASC